MTNIEIKNMTDDQIRDLIKQGTEILNKPKYPARGVPCEIYGSDGYEACATLRYSNGDGTFSHDSDCSDKLLYNNFQPIQQGLTFSDEVITSEDITMDMDKCLCLAWDYDYGIPKFRAIDSKIKGAFYPDGKRNGYSFEHYRLCTTSYELLPQWAKDYIDGLED